MVEQPGQRRERRRARPAITRAPPRHPSCHSAPCCRATAASTAPPPLQFISPTSTCAGAGNDNGNARKGNASARGGHKGARTYVSHELPAALALPAAAAALTAGPAPVALALPDPNRMMWGYCRTGTHVSDDRCTCGKYEQVGASAQVSQRARLGTRLNQRKACKEQRPANGPKTRFFVAEFETEEALLAAAAAATATAS